MLWCRVGPVRSVALAPSPRMPTAARDLPPPAHPTPARRRILLVDDDPDAADSLGLLLSMDGHTVVLARDGAHALALAESRPPEVALLDIALPGMDGLELARRLRARPGGERLLMVALTGYGRPQDIARSRSAGFDAHLVKPVDPDRLRDALARR